MEFPSSTSPGVAPLTVYFLRAFVRSYANCTNKLHDVLGPRLPLYLKLTFTKGASQTSKKFLGFTRIHKSQFFLTKHISRISTYLNSTAAFTAGGSLVTNASLGFLVQPRIRKPFDAVMASVLYHVKAKLNNTLVSQHDVHTCPG